MKLLLKALEVSEKNPLKRLYEQVQIIPAGQVFEVSIDGRSVKTPMHRKLQLPTEALAQKIADTILNEFTVSSIVVKVEKPGALRGSKSVGVTIKRP